MFTHQTFKAFHFPVVHIRRPSSTLGLHNQILARFSIDPSSEDIERKGRTGAPFPDTKYDALLSKVMSRRGLPLFIDNE